ncbi:MAG TPA: hypothetical protein DHV03_06885 [Alphaproteobacteria bacterium]|nr:hypothetical protein [Paracoccaceae bacterium]RCL81809.1 MAG: DUF1289 domain-containing protein [SAR116 cluster bacterium]RPH14505.1 MAG: DUF1289 domain-containing protein [Alphaproteobacteria bacterium TMED150]HBQ22916.1 hypothetical protein [Alphaproteobacteria bacterium]HCJ62037.1 hypothetical protein [Alphaproteobacteria bacterium]
MLWSHSPQMAVHGPTNGCTSCGIAILRSSPMTMESPCQKICRLNESRTYCTACKRSLAEIADWAKLDQATRDKIVDELPTRRLDRN